MSKRLIESLPLQSEKERSVIRDRCREAIRTGAGNSASAETVLRALSALEKNELAAREHAGYQAKVVYCFTIIPPSDSERMMIQVLGDPCIDDNASALAAAMGWKDHSAWNLHFGLMAKKRAKHLGTPPIFDSGFRLFSEFLADLDDTGQTCGLPLLYKFHPEVRDAFIELKLLPKDSMSSELPRKQDHEKERSRIIDDTDSKPGGTGS